MQSHSENSEFSSVDFSGIRNLDPGGVYQVINVRNQEFIDHSYLGHVELQEGSVDDMVSLEQENSDNVKIEKFCPESLPETSNLGKSIIVRKVKSKSASQTPSSDKCNSQYEKIIHEGQVFLIQKPETLPEERSKELPHKKRILRKKDPEVEESTFNCQLCGQKTKDQFLFYHHLKSHYEEKTDTRPSCWNVGVQVGGNLSDEEYEDEEEREEIQEEIIKRETLETDAGIEVPEEIQGEFSDSEDMLEGMRTVVNQVQDETCEDDIPAEENVEELQVYDKDWLSEESLEQQQDENYLAQSFVVYINKADLEKHIEAGSVVLSGEMSQNILEKSLIDVIPEITEAAGEEDEVVEIKNTRITRQLTRKAIGEPQLTESATRKRRKLKQELESDVQKDEGKSSGKKKSKCNQCDREFNSRNALRYHILSHTGQRPHQCEVCGKAFFSNSALKVHKRLHTGVRPYTCSHCDRSFRQWGDLKYHIASKHSEEKNHQCEFCGKDFARRYSLVIHRRIHTGERNYTCEVCSKTFRAGSYLQNHRRIHTGEKPYACTVCGKKFRVRGDMKRHMNTHFPKDDPREKIVKAKKKKLKDDGSLSEDQADIKVEMEEVENFELAKDETENVRNIWPVTTFIS
ncbi:hypothetical protein DMENIID0001_037150 [Sergentomyia squamirostris]